MREILFRYVVKRKIDGKIHLHLLSIEEMEATFNCPDERQEDIYNLLNNEHWELIAREQFTGLKDKNGREIYEGDIVDAFIYGDETPQKLIVHYTSCGFCIDYKDSESDIMLLGWFVGSLEVIGNIHEHPDLLEKQS